MLDSCQPREVPHKLVHLAAPEVHLACLAASQERLPVSPVAQVWPDQGWVSRAG